jgi:cytochrome c5
MKTLSTLLIVSVALALAAAGTCRAEDQMDAATKARIAAFEKGPATIDVTKYPEAVRKNYEVFQQKCTLCHALSRPVNCDFVLPGEWSRYVKRMMHKPGSMITENSAKKIYEFLVYDASVRKKDALDAKLATLKPEERTAEEAKIRDLHKVYDKP